MKFFQPAEHLKHEYVGTIDQLSEIASLRYRSYVDAGHIAENENGLFIDEYDLLPSTTVIGIWQNQALVSSIRLHTLSDTQACSATYSAFRDVLQPKIDAGETIVDFARFVVAPELGRERLSVMAHTLFVARRFAVATGSTIAVAAVREEHIKFYNRVGGFEKEAEPRAYNGLNAELALISVRISKELHGD